MTTDPDKSPGDGTIIDLDPDKVVEDRAATDAPKPNARSDKRYTSWVAGAAALAIAAVGGGWVYRDYLSSYFPSDQVAQALGKAEAVEASAASMREQLQSLDRIAGQLTQDVDALETSLATTSSDAKAATNTVGNMSGRVDKLESSLDELRKANAALSDALGKLQSAPPAQTGAAPATVDLSAITTRLEALEKDVASLKAGRADQADTALLSQSLSDLKAKLASGAGFVDELGRLQRMAPAAAGLDVLASHAASGVATTPQLADALNALAPSLAPASTGATTNAQSDDWWTWASDLVSDIITIRDAGDTDWSTVARAAAAFAESGDLTQAMAHVESAEGARPQSLQDWLDTARARVSADTALADVEAAVLRMIAAKG